MKTTLTIAMILGLVLAFASISPAHPCDKSGPRHRQSLSLYRPFISGGYAGRANGPYWCARYRARAKAMKDQADRPEDQALAKIVTSLTVIFVPPVNSIGGLHHRYERIAA